MIEAMKQALEALEADTITNEKYCDAITSLRRAIEQAEKGIKRFVELQSHIAKISQQENERCLEKYGTLDCPRCGGSGHIGDAEAIEQAGQQEPVMIYHGGCTIDCGEYGHHNMEMLKLIPAGTKLYTQPAPAQPVQEPLDDGFLKITMQVGELEVSRLVPLVWIETAKGPEVERHSKQTWLDLQNAAHGIKEQA